MHACSILRVIDFTARVVHGTSTMLINVENWGAYLDTPVPLSYLVWGRPIRFHIGFIQCGQTTTLHILSQTQPYI